MLTRFLDGLSSKISERMAEYFFTPAFFFWGAGLLAWLLGPDAHFGDFPWREKFALVLKVLQGANTDTPLYALLIALVIIVPLSGLLARGMEKTVLSLLSGRWAAPAIMGLAAKVSSFREKRIQFWVKRFDDLLDKLNALNASMKAPPPDESDEASRERKRQFTMTDMELRDLPLRDDIQATRLGNILKAGEKRSRYKYGLDLHVCHSRLWMLLPENVKNELTGARARLYFYLRCLIWSCASLLWLPLFWPLIFASAGGMWFAYHRLLEAARVYGLLNDTAFDLYRRELYKALAWPLPANPDAEKKSGKKLNQYLWRGMGGDAPVFQDAPPEPKKSCWPLF